MMQAKCERCETKLEWDNAVKIHTSALDELWFCRACAWKLAVDILRVLLNIEDVS